MVTAGRGAQAGGGGVRPKTALNAAEKSGTGSGMEFRPIYLLRGQLKKPDD